MEANDIAILKAIQEAYSRPDLGVEYVSEQDRVVFRAGIREVVGWMETKGYLHPVLPNVWLAQLKKWGVESR